MQDLNDLYYFSQVVEQGGFSAAARALDIPKSRLSRRISHLEESLGVRLLQRTTRRLRLTAAGERYLHYCKEMAASARRRRRHASAAIRARRAGGRELSRVHRPGHPGAAAARIPGCLPAISVQLLVSNRRVDLISEGWTSRCGSAPSSTRTPNWWCATWAPRAARWSPARATCNVTARRTRPRTGRPHHAELQRPAARGALAAAQR